MLKKAPAVALLSVCLLGLVFLGTCWHAETPSDVFSSPQPRSASPKYRASVEYEPGTGLRWTADLGAALAQAKKDGGRVFLAVEAVVDANCLLNRRRVLNQPLVKTALRRYVLVSLDISVVPDVFYEQTPTHDQQVADAQTNEEFQQKVLGTIQVPLYAVLEPVDDTHFRIVGVYDEFRINDVAAFVQFVWCPSSKRQWRDGTAVGGFLRVAWGNTGREGRAGP